MANATPASEPVVYRYNVIESCFRDGWSLARGDKYESSTPQVSRALEPADDVTKAAVDIRKAEIAAERGAINPVSAKEAEGLRLQNHALESQMAQMKAQLDRIEAEKLAVPVLARDASEQGKQKAKQ